MFAVWLCAAAASKWAFYLNVKGHNATESVVQVKKKFEASELLCFCVYFIKS